jgi:DNA-binding HxlR family transcriptional regulator
VPEFRYAQYCPLARAAEVVGERWTLLVVRELLLGPKRFSDLKRALLGVSTSVLSERLARLEERGVIARSEVRPPTPATLYELTPLGERLLPAVLELARWGGSLLGGPEPGDHMEPDWLRLGFTTFARKVASPTRRFEIRLEGAEVFCVSGGPNGTEVSREYEAAETTVHAESALPLFALAAGQLAPADALRDSAITADGDVAALDEFSELFDMAPERSEPHNTQGA